MLEEAPCLTGHTSMGCRDRILGLLFITHCQSFFSLTLPLQLDLGQCIPEKVLTLQGLIKVGHSCSSNVQPPAQPSRPQGLVYLYFTWN